MHYYSQWTEVISFILGTSQWYSLLLLLFSTALWEQLDKKNKVLWIRKEEEKWFMFLDNMAFYAKTHKEKLLQ